MSGWPAWGEWGASLGRVRGQLGISGGQLGVDHMIGELFGLSATTHSPINAPLCPSLLFLAFSLNQVRMKHQQHYHNSRWAYEHTIQVSLSTALAPQLPSALSRSPTFLPHPCNNIIMFVICRSVLHSIWRVWIRSNYSPVGDRNVCKWPG